MEKKESIQNGISRNDVVSHIANELAKLNVDHWDTIDIAEALADGVLEDAQETCGESLTMIDIDIAFHRALITKCGVAR